ncbi:hypothetical protein WHR41_08245 [Cladosporium halotolerans]|uniref:Cardiolipin synthase N-terminal domain-containing protein n=1 Tax=Cladosporium halotolerans TaxID=1052096 RepID=A0AB34KD30_9PEZI
MFNLLLQICLAALCHAAPLSTTSSNATQYGTGGGIVGFIILVLDILVWIEVLKSSRPVSHKLLWSVLVFIFPIGGLIIYWIFSDRQKWNNGNGYEVIAEETR